LSATLAFGQYFFSRNGVEVAPARGDFVVDGGACLGDTALVFSNAVGAGGRVYAFDPVEDNLLACIENSENFQYKNVSVYPTGLSNRNVDARPIKVNCYAPGFSSGNAESNHQEVPLRSLDFMLETGEVEKVDFIKLDVEGAEMETLAGARSCIDRFRPKMAISTYHKPDDFFEIINYIKATHPFYSLYLDHYTIHREETVLYCLAQ
jgi:FkbM family methyltransferase